MIDQLLDLPAHLRERLARALEAGLLGPPYGESAVRSALGTSAGADGLCEALQLLESRGIAGPAVALALDVATRTAARIDRPDLVWSGPEVPGLHARDTRRVYEELVGSAQRSLWVSTYAYYDGHQAFKTLASRMDEMPGMQVTMLLNIQRKWADHTAADDLVLKFADRFWKTDWPGARQPDIFYDPRSLEFETSGGVLHAKAVVADDEAAFVTSANLTEAAFDRNIEIGVLSRDCALAASLTRHFQTLIDQSLLRPLPPRASPGSELVE
jgi:phosphatidylserine/phosphatidylglycerophosphate/cardiolipin synthase-like enzyme